MKKIILTLLVLVSVFFLVGCREKHRESGEAKEEKTISHQSVSYFRGEGSICFELPESWKYAVVDEEEGTGFSIEIWPESQSSGKLSLQYHDDGFGVCGTDMKAEKITLGQYEAEKGTYGDSKFWNYISLMGVPRSYVIINEGAESWRQEEKDEAMQILSTICVAYESNGMLIEYPEYRVAWVGYAEIDHTQRVPVFKCENLAELNQFKENYKAVFQFSASYDEIPSFDDVCKNYGQEFFEEYTLLLAYVSEGSGSYRHGVDSIYIDEESVILHTRQLNHPEVVTTGMAGWLLTVGVKKEDIETCTVFDADLTIAEEDERAQKTSELQAEGVDTSILVRFNGSLYGRSFAMIDYAGEGEPIGKIDRLTEKENIPLVDGETNTKELLGALIYGSTSDSIVLYYNNDYVLFEKIEEMESVVFAEDFSGTGDLLYRGEEMHVYKLTP